MFVLEEVSIDRHGQQVMSEAHFTLSPGELVAVIGPNGAGKSTLLQTLSGDLVPNQGKVSLNGRKLSDWNLSQLAQRRAVYNQGDYLSFPFTVYEVVMLGRMPHQHKTTIQDEEVVRAALRVTDTTHFSDRRYTELSGGERARVRLARALAQVWPNRRDKPHQQNYLLLDEPLAALDLHYQYHMLDMLKSRVGPHLGILIVMHDLGLAARYADRVVLVDEGTLVADGPPVQVLTPKRLSHHYRLPMQVLNLPELDYPLITAASTAPTPA